MGRKKGKQGGGVGSKRLRHAAEIRRFAEAREDLFRASPRHETPLRRDEPRRTGKAPDAVDAEPPLELELEGETTTTTTTTTTTEAPFFQSAPFFPQQSKKTLVGLCAACVGSHLDRFSALDVGTHRFFGLLPREAVELISTCGRDKARPWNLGLFAQIDVTALTLSGDFADLSDLAPRRRDDVPDDWEVDAPILLSGCLSLASLDVDGPNFVDVGRWPSLRRLCLGPRVSLEVVERVLLRRDDDALPALAVLDLRNSSCDGDLTADFWRSLLRHLNQRERTNAFITTSLGENTASSSLGKEKQRNPTPLEVLLPPRRTVVLGDKDKDDDPFFSSCNPFSSSSSSEESSSVVFRSFVSSRRDTSVPPPRRGRP